MRALAVTCYVKARNDLFSISNKLFFRNSIIISSYNSRKMSHDLAMQCNLIWISEVCPPRGHNRCGPQCPHMKRNSHI